MYATTLSSLHVSVVQYRNALPDLKLLIRTSSVNNFKARDSTFILTVLRTAEMLKNMGIPVPKKVLTILNIELNKQIEHVSLALHF